MNAKLPESDIVIDRKRMQAERRIEQILREFATANNQRIDEVNIVESDGSGENFFVFIYHSDKD